LNIVTLVYNVGVYPYFIFYINLDFLRYFNYIKVTNVESR